MEPSRKIVTRIAPSPTGLFHIGTARTALFSWLYAKRNGGEFHIRVEDTDRARSKKEYEDNILAGMEWLGLTHDGLVRQSERVDLHRAALEKLVASDAAYISKEEPSEEGKRAEVIRFRNPGGEVSFKDEVRGLITFDVSELGDFVIAKDMNEPLYHLAVVVDDIDMNVTHVIRGEDHISNTPRQILLYRALGAELPTYAHLPLILAPDRSKMSKRFGATSVDAYREQGYVREAMLNFLGLLGFNPGDDRDIISLDELVECFTLDRIQKGGAIFDVDRLKFFNRHYIRSNSDEYFINALTTADARFSTTTANKTILATIVRERVELANDIATMLENNELSYAVERPTPDVSKLSWKGQQSVEETRTSLTNSRDALASASWETIDEAKAAVWPLAESTGKGQTLWPLRVALTGLERSPDPFTVAALLGKDETIARLDAAIAACK
jgi:glutamyl-tRNA synthetase